MQFHISLKPRVFPLSPFPFSLSLFTFHFPLSTFSSYRLKYFSTMKKIMNRFHILFLQFQNFKSIIGNNHIINKICISVVFSYRSSFPVHLIPLFYKFFIGSWYLLIFLDSYKYTRLLFFI